MSAISDPNTLTHFSTRLHAGDVVAYPTEAVFGLGCDPDNQQAVEQLLRLKQRPIEKGLILIAASYQQLLPYIDDNAINEEQRLRMFSHWPGPVTFVVPASTAAPTWITGKFDSIAVRVTDHNTVKDLCNLFGKPLVSTSANLSGLPPAKTPQEVTAQFGRDFPVIEAPTGGRVNPSEIRNVVTGEQIRQG